MSEPVNYDKQELEAMSPMQVLCIDNNTTFYWADNNFKVPGVYYWDGVGNCHVLNEIKGLQKENTRMALLLKRIEEECDGGDGTIDATALEKFQNRINGILKGEC
jgi:hypothetical protein